MIGAWFRESYEFFNWNLDALEVIKQAVSDSACYDTVVPDGVAVLVVPCSESRTR